MVICTLHSLRSRFPFSLARMLSDLGNIACADQVILELTNSQRLEEALTRKQERDSSLPQISLWKLELMEQEKQLNKSVAGQEGRKRKKEEQRAKQHSSRACKQAAKACCNNSRLYNS